MYSPWAGPFMMSAKKFEAYYNSVKPQQYGSSNKTKAGTPPQDTVKDN